jgi:hypothetical protein
MMKADFKKLCRVIVATNGNPSTKQIESCGYSFETFLRLLHYDRKKLVKGAEIMLCKFEEE